MQALQALIEKGVPRDRAWLILQELAMTEDVIKELGIPSRDSTHHNYRLGTLQLHGGLSLTQAEIFLAEYEGAV
jgi:hypothetical protein